MNISAIFHRRLFGFCTILDNHHVEIKFQTGIDVEAVSLVHGDPYLWQPVDDTYVWKHQEEKMTLIGTTCHHKFWEIVIACPTQRLKYYFRLKNNDESICFGDHGVFDDSPYHHWNGFFLPFIRQQEALKPPAWVSKITWYQIFFDRFSDGDRSNNRADGYSWQDPARLLGYFGGDGQGILNHLEQIKELGFTGLYLTPIFLAKSNHKYDTIDYYQIDPDFGDLDLFKKLVEKAHQLGLKVMLDGVFNHTGTDFFAFRDVMLQGRDSKYYHWYHFQQLDPPIYQTFASTKQMPKLNTDHPEVQDYFLEVMKYWIRETKIDAWRIDVANEIANRFYQRMYSEIKEEFPDCYLLAEIWHDPIDWLDHRFDAAMNYQLGHIIKDLINSGDIQNFMDQFYRYQYRYPNLIRQSTFTLLDSHDTQRIRYMLGDDLDKTLLAFALLSLQQGGICLLYGSEYALLGESSEHDRALYPQQANELQRQFSDKLKQLLAIRSDNIDLINNGRVTISTKNNLLYYTIDESLSLVVNLGDESILYQDFDQDLFTNREAYNQFIDPYRFIIVKKQ